MTKTKAEKSKPTKSKSNDSKSNDAAKNHVQIFDTTLRDGEQSPGISLDAGEKLEIAEQLSRLGVDIIEAGFPVASQGDFEAVQAIAKVVTDSIICGLCRTSYADIDRCFEAIESAPKKRIHTFIATSESHMKHKLKMTREQVKTEASQAVSRARSYVDDVEFSPEDGSRSDFDFMCEVLQIAVDSGATVLNIPDTVGFGVPEEYGKTLTEIRNRIKGDYIISTHCHDDLGLTVANSLAGVMAGARQVECAINGIGERAGNAALEEVVMAINTRNDYFGDLSVNIKTDELLRTSRLVSQLTGYAVQHNKAVVGRNAFSHESGIHQHGVLNERTTYEIMDPKDIGQNTNLYLGKHSGRAAFANHIKEMGITITAEALNSAFKRFKDLADRKKVVTDADIEALVVEELADTGEYEFELVGLECGTGNGKEPTASIKIKTKGGEVLEASTTGGGMIDAVCQAIREATGIDGKLVDFSAVSVSAGEDAMAEVSMRLTTPEGIEISGRGLSIDVVEASAAAYLNAINKLSRTSLETFDPTDRPGHI